MAPVTSSLLLLILCCAGSFAKHYNNYQPEHPHKVKPGSCPAPSTDCGKPHPHGECKNDEECRPSGKCIHDEDCPEDLKCCIVKCTPKCTKPIPVKPGSCPAPSTVCEMPHPHGECKNDEECRPSGKCKHDEDCPEDLKCCIVKCTPKCTKPIPVKPKPGKCPVMHKFVPCKTPHPEIECTSDYQCPGNKKCCHCNVKWVCKPPV